jgi:hypothetical protein
MKDKWDIWVPWYLITQDKPSKVEHIITITFHVIRINFFFIWTTDMMTIEEELVLLCVWGQKYKSKHYLLLIIIF